MTRKNTRRAGLAAGLALVAGAARAGRGRPGHFRSTFQLKAPT